MTGAKSLRLKLAWNPVIANRFADQHQSLSCDFEVWCHKMVSQSKSIQLGSGHNGRRDVNTAEVQKFDAVEQVWKRVTLVN